MPRPLARRIALRAVQSAMAVAGVFFVMLIFARQAHADAGPSPALPALPAVTAPVTSAVTAVASQATSGAANALPSSPADATAGSRLGQFGHRDYQLDGLRRHGRLGLRD